MKPKLIPILAALSLLACEAKNPEVQPTEVQTTQAQTPNPTPALPEKKVPSDPVDKVQDPGQKLVFIFAEALKRVERNPDNCAAAWEDMEAYLNSRKSELHQAVAKIIEEAMADPKGSERKMKQITALGKEVFGGEGNPMAEFEKRCPKEKESLKTWLNEVMKGALAEGMAKAQKKGPQIAK